MNAKCSPACTRIVASVIAIALVFAVQVSCSPAPTRVLDERSIVDMITSLDVSQDSSAIKTLHQKSTQYIQYQKWEKARNDLDRALRIDPKHAGTWTRMAFVNLKTGSLKQAKNMAFRSNSLAGGSVVLHTINWRIISETCAKTGEDSCLSEAQKKLNQLID